MTHAHIRAETSSRPFFAHPRRFIQLLEKHALLTFKRVTGAFTRRTAGNKLTPPPCKTQGRGVSKFEIGKDNSSVLQRGRNNIRRFQFALGIQVRVNIARRLNIRVTQPVLDHLHRHLFGQEKRRAGMPELVEAYVPETVLVKKHAEVVCDIIRGV